MDFESDAVPSTAQTETGDVTTTDPASAGQSDPSQSNQQDANPSEQPSGSEIDAKSEKPPELADIVSKALEGKNEESSPSEQQVGQKPKAENADPEKDTDLPGAEDEGEDGIPKEFHKHPAWQRLQKQRDDARAEVDQFRADSEEFHAITDYMSENQIAAEEVAETLQWLALRNSDPVKFAEAILNLADGIRQNMGLTLPPELEARVNAGEITEDDAKALVKAQAERDMLKNHSRRQTETRRTQDQQTQQKQLSANMAQTVNDWEKQIQAKDLDYGRKRQLVNRTIRSYIQEYGMPKSPEQALKYATTAYQEVTKQLNGMLPARKENNPQTPSGKQVETNFQPKSVEDVVAHVLQGGS